MLEFNTPHGTPLLKHGPGTPQVIARKITAVNRDTVVFTSLRLFFLLFFSHSKPVRETDTLVHLYKFLSPNQAIGIAAN